jgi:predicted nucleotide-binding protein
MAQINQRVLAKIAEKKGTDIKAVYPQITAIVHETFLDRDLAALVLASRMNININRYASADQMQAIRGHLGVARNLPAPTPPAAAAAAPAAARRSSRPARAPRTKPTDNSVFVIHGRDLALRDSMYGLLSALGCKPVEFQQAVAQVRGTGNPFVGEVLDKVFTKAQALVVLLSADDEAKLKDHFLRPTEKRTEGTLQGQARANVIYEAGMAMARHQEKTIMVQVGAMKSFSDIFGRHILRLDDSFASRNDFVGRLAKICKVDRTGNTWTTVGNFVPAAGKPRKKKKKVKKR